MWQLKGNFEGITFVNGKHLVTFSTSEIGEKPVFGDMDLTIKVDKYRPPKSLSANGYYWALMNQLSDKLSNEGAYTSVARLHNLHLRSMWTQIIKLNHGSIIPFLLEDSTETENEVLEDENLHIMPIPLNRLPKDLEPVVVSPEGKRRIWYLELRGCRTFDSKEFSRLLDICIEDCRAQGIKTKEDYEIQRLEGYEKYR